jgi:hypothetical protein
LCLPVGSSITAAEMARPAEPGSSGGSRRRHRLRRWRRQLVYVDSTRSSNAAAYVDYESNCGRHLHHRGDGHARNNHLARDRGDSDGNRSILALVEREGQSCASFLLVGPGHQTSGPKSLREILSVQLNSIGRGRVPQVRQSVPGPKMVFSNAFTRGGNRTSTRI